VRSSEWFGVEKKKQPPRFYRAKPTLLQCKTIGFTTR